MADAAVEFLALARALTEAGETGLKRELYKSISDAAEPLASEISDADHLRAYMPTRYAGVLAGDLKVSTYKRTTGEEPGVTLVARAPTFGGGGRKVAQRNRGVITHPVFGRGPRRTWDWKVQTAGMRPGFFDDPVAASGPRIREAVASAVERVKEQIYAAR